MDVFGDHAPCCHHGTSLVFRHNNVRDILGHSARAAGLAAVVIEKKNQVDGSKEKPGDITVQQYHRGFATSAFDVTISHPLQKKYIEIAMEEAGVVAEEAHDRKLQKSLAVCEKEGIHFVPLTGGSRDGSQVDRAGKCARRLPRVSDSPQSVRADLVLSSEALGSVCDRRLELACDRAL